MRLFLAFTIALSLAAGILAAGASGSIQAAGIPVFAYAGVVGLVLHWLAFLPAWWWQTERYFDLTGALSFLLTVVVTLLSLPRIDLRIGLLALMVSLWAIRLGTFLFWRVLRQGGDGRFDDIKPRFARFALTWTLGGLWVLVSIAPALAAMTTLFQQPMGTLSWVGGTLWVAGFSLEVVADLQKSRFRADPANHDRFITHGVWAWSRHPNYFGEVVLWTGVACVAAPVLAGWQLITLISPLLILLLLTRVSGIPLLERRADARWGNDPVYLEYKQRTPALIPWPFRGRRTIGT